MFRPDSSAHVHIDRQFPSDGGSHSSPYVAPATARRLNLVERFAKRTVDIIGALLFFVLLGPIYLATALCIRLSMGSPVHFGQVRLGQGGRRFRFYKFRSMLADSDAVLEQYLSKNDVARTEWDTFQKLQKDPRITPMGNFIRRLSLDELPQFWNVLKGDMSLVGPRPCMERQRTLYGRNWPQYCAMKPGITGLWQVSGRNRLPYAKRVELDAYYVTNWSLWLDFKILLKTFIVVLKQDGCH
ncbi:sugar transferase [Variovorax dokdonensis]|uniref:Sugar transferase n=1 Tax=Variovorax dokdonensis TaxID=344883 RepID=A0ABT7N6J3_9BURK|nr:sugar transferase [Variovorax dokdonensis]MDM0043545.1 sugar transferase [Variovorax dokdonensis]